MKLLEINNTDLFSTGNIMKNIAVTARKRGHEVLTASKYTKTSILNKNHFDPHLYIGNRVGNTVHRYWSWMTDLQDTASILSTYRFINKIENFKPDLIHIHDIVGWYLNIDILFNYLKKINIPVVWTFHDCWAFTGRCIYFDEAGCDRWQNGCGKCPQINYMPKSWWFDLSKWNYKRKKRLFTSLNNLTIVTPSQWLADLTKKSFLKDYNIKVINNGINLEIFKPTQAQIYKELKKDNKKIILGVAGTWSKRKGLEDFIKMDSLLSDNYKIVLVGLDSKEFPLSSKIQTIPRTHNAKELAEIYTAADVFCNPTYEDNFPTVNLEALACGSPVVTYNTGGSPESITKETGLVVPKGNLEEMVKGIVQICSSKTELDRRKCRERAQLYDMKDKFNEYVNLFENINNNDNTRCSFKL